MNGSGCHNDMMNWMHGHRSLGAGHRRVDRRGTVSTLQWRVGQVSCTSAHTPRIRHHQRRRRLRHVGRLERRRSEDRSSMGLDRVSFAEGHGPPAGAAGPAPPPPPDCGPGLRRWGDHISAPRHGGLPAARRNRRGPCPRRGTAREASEAAAVRAVRPGSRILGPDGRSRRRRRDGRGEARPAGRLSRGVNLGDVPRPDDARPHLWLHRGQRAEPDRTGALQGRLGQSQRRPREGPVGRGPLAHPRATTCRRTGRDGDAVIRRRRGQPPATGTALQRSGRLADLVGPRVRARRGHRGVAGRARGLAECRRPRASHHGALRPRRGLPEAAIVHRCDPPGHRIAGS